MDEFTGKYSIKLAGWLGVNASFYIRVPEFTLAVPAFKLQVAMVIEPINNLCRRFLRHAFSSQYNSGHCESGT
jgi:hypothetical protein